RPYHLPPFAREEPNIRAQRPRSAGASGWAALDGVTSRNHLDAAEANEESRIRRILDASARSRAQCSSQLPSTTTSHPAGRPQAGSMPLDLITVAPAGPVMN